MATLVENGQKTSTTRYKPKKIGLSQAVKGSRFKPIVFGTIEYFNIKETTWQWVINNAYDNEGFKSPEEMLAYLKKEKLIKKDLSDKVFFCMFWGYKAARAPLGAEATEYPPSLGNSQGVAGAEHPNVNDGA